MTFMANKQKRSVTLKRPDEHGGPMKASTLSSTNNLTIFPVVTLLLHPESKDTKLQQQA